MGDPDHLRCDCTTLRCVAADSFRSLWDLSCRSIIATKRFSTTMDSLPIEVLDLIALFALPSAPPVEKRASGVPPDRLALLHRCMESTAEWRLINHRWRTLMDSQYSTVWYHLALFLNLEPPSQLYAGGTYRDVCQYLLKADKEKRSAIAELAERRRTQPRYACGIRMVPRKPENHPQPLAHVKLSPASKQRIAENAKALENFLRSLNYSLVRVEQNNDVWSESALIRYRMFLFLKQTHPNVWLVPTVDIEFCWLTHIFRTQTYWKDMTALGINPKHSICLQSYGQVATFSQAICATANLWNKTFGESRYPYLPPGTDTSIKIWKVETKSILEDASVYQDKPYSFFPAMGAKVSVPPPQVDLPLISIRHQDIAADLKWFPELEQGFKDLVSNEYFHDRYRMCDVFIKKQVIPSYERFLDLSNRHGGDEVKKSPAPPYVLDLVWHAHQLDPVRYKNDCMSLFGCEFWHDPWPHGLGKSTPLSKEFECQWKQTFGTHMADDWKFYLESDGSE